MRKKKSIFLPISFLLLLSLACNLSSAPTVLVVTATQGNQTADSQQAIDQAIQETFAVQTQMGMAVQETLAAMPTETPQFTFTPADTPTPTATFTPEKAQVSVSIDTNCRTGPGEIYDYLGALHVGQTADVIGKNQSGDTWIVQLPGNPAVTCWLWGQYATVTGSSSNLPIFTPPPTPTPQPGFEVSYAGSGICSGVYDLQFKIKNTGSVTWESTYIKVTDTTNNKSFNDFENSFKEYNYCVVLHVVPDRSIQGMSK